MSTPRAGRRPDRCLVIMAKAPRAGHAKTRLAGSLPAATVLDIYRCLLADTVALALSVVSAAVFVMSPATDVDELRRLVPVTVAIVPQHGEGLAAGLASTFDFFDDGFARVVALDSDSPHVPRRLIESAFDALDDADVVAGPTTDGGYYLVGMKAKHPGLFEKDRLGTRSALDALRERAVAQRLALALVEECYDVDEHADLVRLARDLAVAPHQAPRTAALLAALRIGA